VNDNEIAQLERNRLSCKKSTKNCQASRSSSALFPSAPSPSLPTTILHGNSSYAHHCFFLQREAWVRGSKSSTFRARALRREVSSMDRENLHVLLN
jgi:hypothetical protein